MSLAGYLFGNVDEQGRLDADLDDVNTFFQSQIQNIVVKNSTNRLVGRNCRS
jgi:hypothetical protein